ncbi:hypothetical protein FE784_26120 [Paenibacillus hemerocallicola]|uniref:Aerobactin siderophore biosynthesis IucA/IucC-like C-terminal domain-containing protein n=1 Tax=Paenibacillus hemerocallicola TaxID=1172614 RepID=A0A5C4T2J1_9BACL|nr:IucA/IucC family C-terminal-domain containing protein [Paenibacillus hemerocallicola]TNJ63278.1 hypothetical protein FE784_26120 [Paenibacillus hemerocallicola]
MSSETLPKEWQERVAPYCMGAHDPMRLYRRTTRVSDLLGRERCEAYLDWLGDYIGSPSRRVTASTLAKRYAFLVAAPVLAAMTTENQVLEFTPDQCILETTEQQAQQPNGTRLPSLGLTGWRIAEASADQRSRWRERVMRSLFAGHVTPLFHALSATAKVPLVLLWENAMVRIVPLFEDLLEQAGDGPDACRIREDFDTVVRTSPGDWFGEARNPLAALSSRYGEASAGQAPRRRRTCCLYVEISGEYCRACPIEPG